MRKLWNWITRQDVTEARAERDKALVRVQHDGNQAFIETARTTLRAICMFKTYGTHIIVDDLWTELHRMGPVPDTTDNRVMGSVMMWGRREGLIRPTEQFKTSAQIKGHATPRRVWEIV